MTTITTNTIDRSANATSRSVASVRKLRPLSGNSRDEDASQMGILRFGLQLASRQDENGVVALHEGSKMVHLESEVSKVETSELVTHKDTTA